MTQNQLIHLETIAQIISGNIIALVILYFYGMTLTQSLSLQVIFFITSYIRSYFIRKTFSKFMQENKLTYRYTDQNVVHINLYLDKVRDFCRSQQYVVEYLDDFLKVIDSDVSEDEVNLIYNKVLMKDDCEDYKHYNRESLQDKVAYIKFKTGSLVSDYKYYLESDFKTSIARFDVLLELLTSEDVV